ncbi:hypothetical protein BU23DRAFT_626372 [Bimuria novae-zelandiae CBS 107.79]|uniref:Uncharacterized protein n=1 Tax=Bimuria novae-zelandiae CBS 107.79 TaxID=1447943 RepID=A0A6A5VPM3_9PLEO|nr:hypothetical protein BU23DRAFT_626372 [Bimuria novae-zelandiae CBS 107.79]
MPPRVTKPKPKAVRHPKIAPRPTAQPSAPAPPAPASASAATPYTPFSPGLAREMDRLIQIPEQIWSLKKGLLDGLFPGYPAEHQAYTRIQELQNIYIALRLIVDRQLAALGYRPSNFPIPALPPKQNTGFPGNGYAGGSMKGRGGKNGNNVKGVQIHTHTPSHKHKYGPTSPHYTVDKALKRKAEQSLALHTSSHKPTNKKRKIDHDSDFVETDCESEYEPLEGKGKGKRVEEEDTSPPPEALSCLTLVPLGKEEKERMWTWSWKGAVGRGCGSEVVQSPLGGRGWVW